MQILNRIFFGAVSTIAFPFVLLYALSSRKLRVSLKERLLGGDWKGLELTGCIWIHAASVGELQGVVPLLAKLRAKTAEPIIITTTSLTGKAKAITLPEIQNALLIPYDHPVLIALAIQKLKPRLFLLFETELWPNLLLQLDKFQVPVILVNGRISDRTYPNYLRIKYLVAPLLLTLSRCLVQSVKDRVRFELIGAPDVRVEGNTKYDIELNELSSEATRLLRDFKAPEAVQVLVCGSVRPGESQIILESYKRLRRKFPNLRLLIAPRHPDQFEIETKNIVQFGFSVSSRTSPREDADVLLLNSLGELKSAYAASTISFVGGTLVPVGGHNPLEPASFSKPILFGPFTQNVEEIAEELVQAQGAIRILSADEFEVEVEKLLLDKDYSTVVGHNAFNVLGNHRGAVSRVMSELEPFLDRPLLTATFKDSALELILKLLEVLYFAITAVRNFCYSNKLFKSYKSFIPVICVGNITVGGNAKSPVTQAIVKFLLSQNLKPVILLRGYAGAEAGPIEVRDHKETLRFGDEACMHKLALGDVPVVVSRSRAAGAKYIEGLSLGDVIVLDDGFQHRALERDVNLLLFDAAAITQATSQNLLPLGRLRESLPGALQRADAICLIQRGDTLETPNWKPTKLPDFKLSLEFSELRNLNSGQAINWSELKGKTVSAIASIAKPEGFKRMIEDRGAAVIKTIFKSDHALWSSEDLAVINSLPGDFIITTAKDFIKLKQINSLSDRLLVAEAQISLTENFKEWMIGKIKS